MNTYNIISADGKSIGSVKGDMLTISSASYFVTAKGVIVAVIPFQSGAVIVKED